MPRRWFLTDKGRAVLGLGPAPTAETVGVPMFDPIPDDVLAEVDRRKLAEDRVAMQDAS